MWFKQKEPKSPAPTELPAAKPAPPVPPAVSHSFPSSPARAASESPSAALSRVTRGLQLRGEIAGREDLWIDGEVEGQLSLEDARVTVGPTGRVRADIFAREIVVRGQVTGQLRAKERVEIGSTGSVRGDAVTKRLAIEDGAFFHGAIEVLRTGHAVPGSASQAANRQEHRATAAAETSPDHPSHAAGQQAAPGEPMETSKAIH